MREFIQYTDYISRIYPELLAYDNDTNKVLSRTLTFQVTDACNLACTYCYQTNKGHKSMSFDIAKQAIDNLLAGTKGFCDYINPQNSPGIILEFIGGEPFLEIELIDKIVDYFRLRAIQTKHVWANRFMISICSNGVLYTDPKVQHFLQKNYNILSFSVTVDGKKELHNACRVFPDGSPSYDLAHAAAKDWMDRGYYMGSKITIAPGNIDYLADSLLYMVEENYKDINANYVYENVWTSEHATKLYYQCKKFSDMFLEKYDLSNYYISLLDDNFGKPMLETDNDNWCGGNGIMLAIDPDGNLYPCLRYMDSSLNGQQKPMIIGNIWDGIATKKDELQKIKCLQCITRKSQSSDNCFYCPIAKGCSWCSAYNYQETGDANKRIIYSCEMHKARCLAISYLWNTYYQKNNIPNHVDLNVPKEWAIPIIGDQEYNNLVILTQSMGGNINQKTKLKPEEII